MTREILRLKVFDSEKGDFGEIEYFTSGRTALDFDYIVTGKTITFSLQGTTFLNAKWLAFPKDNDPSKPILQFEFSGKLRTAQRKERMRSPALYEGIFSVLGGQPVSANYHEFLFK